MTSETGQTEKKDRSPMTENDEDRRKYTPEQVVAAAAREVTEHLGTAQDVSNEQIIAAASEATQDDADALGYIVETFDDIRDSRAESMSMSFRVFMRSLRAYLRDTRIGVFEITLAVFGALSLSSCLHAFIGVAALGVQSPFGDSFNLVYADALQHSTSIMNSLSSLNTVMTPILSTVTVLMFVVWLVTCKFSDSHSALVKVPLLEVSRRDLFANREKSAVRGVVAFSMLSAAASFVFLFVNGFNVGAGNQQVLNALLLIVDIGLTVAALYFLIAPALSAVQCGSYGSVSDEERELVRISIRAYKNTHPDARFNILSKVGISDCDSIEQAEGV